MNKEDKEIKKLLKEAQDYFGKDEKIYIFKCKVVLNFMTDWYIQHMQYSNQ